MINLSGALISHIFEIICGGSMLLFGLGKFVMGTTQNTKNIFSLKHDIHNLRDELHHKDKKDNERFQSQELKYVELKADVKNIYNLLIEYLQSSNKNKMSV